ncbi:hypothetical protein B0H99_10280 [Planomicrobium soli]|uniref:Uncharacterized protein n=1 Tax=Planomicrobium soli TaxID=1176648 RepID=A0A2P8H594_9BACL|nr:hypothetical protein B0H99_10280 [Planomicrobium soli]
MKRAYGGPFHVYLELIMKTLIYRYKLTTLLLRIRLQILHHKFTRRLQLSSTIVLLSIDNLSIKH